jgi:transcription termination factor NusB
MVEQAFFGLSLETIAILALLIIIVVMLLANRKGGGALALATTIPVFWLLSRKMGKGRDELKEIQDEYDRKLEALRRDYDQKIESLRQTLHTELTRNQNLADQIDTDIQTLDTHAKEQVKDASPDELEAIARALLSVSKN